MKKLFLFILLATTLNLFAHFPVIVDSDKSKGVISDVDFAPLQVGVGFFDKWQLYDGNAHSFVSVGILGLMQKSAVTSFAPINMLKKNYFLQCGLLASATEENYFFSFALFNLTDKNYGLQLGAGNISASDWGIQVGLVNLGPQIQIGAKENSCKGLVIGGITKSLSSINSIILLKLSSTLAALPSSRASFPADDKTISSPGIESKPSRNDTVDR